MPRKYKHNCKFCGIYYESPNKTYCSMACRMQDREWIDRMSETKKRQWANGIRQDISKFIKAGSDATRGQPGKKGPDSNGWKGSKASYSAVHHWVKNNWGKPSTCNNLNCPKTGKRFEWANISGNYARERSDWKQLCSFCHKQLDYGTQFPIQFPEEFLPKQ